MLQLLLTPNLLKELGLLSAQHSWPYCNPKNIYPAADANRAHSAGVMGLTPFVKQIPKARTPVDPAGEPPSAKQPRGIILEGVEVAPQFCHMVGV